MKKNEVELRKVQNEVAEKYNVQTELKTSMSTDRQEALALIRKIEVLKESISSKTQMGKNL